MNKICNNLFLNINKFQNSNETFKMILLERKNYDILLKTYYHKLKKEIINDKFNKNIIKLFGGIDSLCKYDILPWNSKYIGFTDYIDSIPLEDLGNNKIMIGLDNYERPFIAILNDDIVSILFQRYSNLESIWACSNFKDFYGHFLSHDKFTIETSKITKLIF